MLDIVFGDSACGSLKMAQHYGQGSYPGGCTGVFILHEDGHKPTKAELKAARQQAEEQKRIAWEKAVPLGGKTSDIFGLTLALSVGDIAEDDAESRRQQVLEQLFGVTLGKEAHEAAQKLSVTRKMQTIHRRVTDGEPLRIWYSNQPDDMCGFYWLMAQLTAWKLESPSVFTVKLPEWECEGDTVVQKSGWGEVAPEEWHRYLPLQEPVPHNLIGCYAHQWRALQQENAPLRAMLNGRLVSMPETLYDPLILREIEAQEDEFLEAHVIGCVLGKYQLGIGDAWVALRIEAMIQSGTLQPVTFADKDSPSYHRMLKKCR